MMEVASLEERIAAAHKAQRIRLEKLVNLCAGLIMLATIWFMIPDLHASLLGTHSLLPELGPALLMMAWAFFLLDLVGEEAVANSRIGAFTAIVWLPLVVVGSWTINSETGPMLGGLGCMLVGGFLYMESRRRLPSGWEVIRYRAVMGGIGLAMSLMLFALESPEGSILYLDLGLLLAATILVAQDSIGGDDKRAIRKEFKRRLDVARVRLLQLKADGVVVDQASSLITTAGEEGHLDPELGLKLIHEALDDIERTLALSEDVDAIRNDAAAAVEKAEDIAPVVRRPRSALVQGDREVELGSLREGELLYRQAKKRAGEVIKWWDKAERAIIEAKNLITGLDSEHTSHLQSILKEAREKLDAEKPKMAYEFAIVIPAQVDAVGEAVENAAEAVEEAERVLSSVDGLDSENWEERMKRARSALEKGDHALARGLSDGVVREIASEREAMEAVRRAKRQRRSLEKRWNERPDAEEWHSRWQAVLDSADELQWSHAANLLDLLTIDLDREDGSGNEAAELLAFVQDEWRVLRNQLEASGVKVDDEQRRECEAAIGEASEAHSNSDWEACLAGLASADGLMEKLRRRV